MIQDLYRLNDYPHQTVSFIGSVIGAFIGGLLIGWAISPQIDAVIASFKFRVK